MFKKIKEWYNSQTESTKTMIWIGIVAIVFIIIRWNYVVEGVIKGFKFYSK